MNKPRKKETVPRASVLGTNNVEITNREAQNKDGISTQESRTGSIPEVTKLAQTKKRKSTMQMGEHRKNTREKKNSIELTITKYDAELVVDKVQ
jgi:hypothetical protein